MGCFVRRWGRWLAFVGLLSGGGAQAIIFFGTGDASHNTTAPTGALANSGWQWQGAWGGFLGTAVAPGFFITAAHVSGGTGQPFSLNGVNYIAVASYLAPDADLRLWQVAGTFPSYAPYYTRPLERNPGAVMFGRSAPRGEAVFADGVFGPELKGWLWGSGDYVQRWGTNTVATILDATGTPVSNRGALPGDLLSFTFDADAGPDEATLAGGDSGGGVFFNDGGTWTLIGINRAVEGSFRLTAAGTTLAAAIFDRGGLYEETETDWVLLPDQAIDQPASLYATRIAGNAAWMASVIAGQVTPERSLTVESAAAPNGPFVTETSARLDAAAGRFVVPTAGAARFYRFRSDGAVKIQSISLSGGEVQLYFGTAGQ